MLMLLALLPVAFAAAAALEEVQLLTADAAADAGVMAAVKAAQPATSTSGHFTPLPPGLEVLLCLSVWYFTMYSALQVANLYYSCFPTPGGRKGRAVMFLEKACSTVDFCPMIGVLFLAIRMRAQQLWPPDGRVEPHVQAWMYLILVGIIASTCSQILAEFLGGPGAEAGPYQLSTSASGARTQMRQPLRTQAGKRPASNGGMALRGFGGILAAAADFFVYVGVVVVIIGLFALPAQPGSDLCENCTWQYKTPIAPAVECTILLTVQFFLIYCGIKSAELYNRLMGQGRSFFLHALHGAKTSVRLCPMLAVLFIGARMRALQMNLDAPPAWAQMAFFLAAYSSYVATCSALATPCVSGESRAELDDNGEVIATGGRAGGAAFAVTVLRYVALVGIVIGVIISGYSVFAMKAPYGETPPVSQTVRCVLILTTMFLVMTIASSVAQSYSQLCLGGVKTDFQKVIDCAEPSLLFIPMMCVLFVGTRMRALQIDVEGAPQKFAQNGMEVATWCVLTQMLVAMATPFFEQKLAVAIDMPVVFKGLAGLRVAALLANIVAIAFVAYGMATLE